MTTQATKHIYPVLTSEQVSKLPWNRLKNIMKSVRAVIDDISRRFGYNYCGTCDPPCHLDDEFETKEERDLALEKVLEPHRQYFNMLKEASKLLPHEKK